MGHEAHDRLALQLAQATVAQEPFDFPVAQVAAEVDTNGHAAPCEQAGVCKGGPRQGKVSVKRPMISVASIC